MFIVSLATVLILFFPTVCFTDDRYQGPEYPVVECWFVTEHGEDSVHIMVREDWAPLGAKRFLELVKSDYYKDVKLFRSLENFIVQFGISKDQRMRGVWKSKGEIKDDRNLNIPFMEGMMSYAGSGPNSRGTQIFITLGEWVPHLGKDPWETPFGYVFKGMDRLQEFLYYGYGEKVNQQKIWQQGYSYLDREFPKLSKFANCELMNRHKAKLVLKHVKFPVVDKSWGTYDMNKEISITFTNKLRFPVTVYWVGGDGKEAQVVDSLVAGKKIQMGSYYSHKFMIRNKEQNYEKKVTVKPGFREFVLVDTKGEL